MRDALIRLQSLADAARGPNALAPIDAELRPLFADDLQKVLDALAPDGPVARLVTACETDFCSPATETSDFACTDDESVGGSTEGETALTFGHIRRVRELLV